MKKEMKCFMMGVGTAVILMASFSLAGNYVDTVNRTFRDIKIRLNGEEVVPKDANGKIVEPFLIEGTTYLPVRAVGEALGLKVDWDGDTSTVFLNDKEHQNSENKSSIVEAYELYQEAENVVNNGANTIAEASKQLSNSMITQFVGSNVKGLEVLMLKDKVNSANARKTFPNEIVIHYFTSNGEKMDESAVTRDKIYDVSVQYDEQGYVSKVLVKEK